MPVANVGYYIGPVIVSDFVTPAYFKPASSGPWDFLDWLRGPILGTPGPAGAGQGRRAGSSSTSAPTGRSARNTYVPPTRSTSSRV